MVVMLQVLNYTTEFMWLILCLNPLPDFTELDLPWSENDIDGSVGNQKWAKTDNSIDVLAGLNASETYNLEVYWKITSNLGDRFDNNTGENFKSLSQ